MSRQGRPRLDVVYAANMRPGDWYAGDVVPDAPTRPVQLFAYPILVARLERFTSEEGRSMVRVITDGPAILQTTPVGVGQQVLVIRDTVPGTCTEFHHAFLCPQWAPDAPGRES